MRFLGETQHKTSQVSDIDHLRWLDQHLNGIELQEIKRDVWVDRRPVVLAENLLESGTFLTTGSEKGAGLLA